MSGVAWGQEAPVITYEDVAGWTGGRYVAFLPKEWTDWPCMLVPDREFSVDTGLVWDWRDYPFNDTLEWSWGEAGAVQQEQFPTANRIERERSEVFGPHTLLDSPEKHLTHVFSLSPDGLFLFASQSRTDFSDSLFSRDYQWPDTVMRFPLGLGDTWDSRMLYGLEPRNDSPQRDSVQMESLWVKREINSYGSFVTLQNDTIPVLGMRAIFALNGLLAVSGDWSVAQHWYLWLSKLHGLVGWARVRPIDPPSGLIYLDSTILRPDKPLDWCGDHNNYVLEVAVRLPDSQQGLAPPTPNSGGRWAVIGTPACADNCDQRVLDITGRRVAATVGTSGVGVRVGPDGARWFVTR